MNFYQGETSSQLPTKRLVSIDILRGLVMVLMVLDHVRTFFSNVGFQATDLTQTTVPLFLTRWITHLCAPSFVFLAGIAVYLYSVRRHPSRQELSKYLIIRGLLLIFLEVTIVRFAWIFEPTYTFSLAGVLWAIGWSMMFLAILIYLPLRVIAGIGILLIFGHNLFDPIQAEQLGKWGGIWAILHEQKMLTVFPGKNLFISYPLIPWIGVIAIGYVFGTVFTLEKSRRLQLLWRWGLGCVAGFLVLRFLNIYGDPEPWSVQANFPNTILSFINCHKYPPSLLFLLMTLGPALLLLYLFEKYSIKFLKPLIIFGQAPLFFYIVHLWLIHLSAILLALPKYGLKAIFFPFVVSRLMPVDYGYDLPKIYSLWIIMIVLLYPICHWFLTYKRNSQKWWLKSF